MPGKQTGSVLGGKKGDIRDDVAATYNAFKEFEGRRYRSPAPASPPPPTFPPSCRPVDV